MVLEYINYEVKENSILVGFKKENFVVYGEIGKVEGYTKEQYLQKIYEQIKDSLDYEMGRFENDLPNSIVTDLDGEEFIPSEPKAKSIKLIMDSDPIQFNENDESIDREFTVVILDQYGDELDIPFEIETNFGEIMENTIVFSSPETYEDVIIRVKVDEFEDSNSFVVYSYIEPEDSQLSEIEDINNNILELQNTIDIILGGEIIE